MNKLLIICGPTATGKTKLALSLAKRHNGELISADSRQVYRGMDIGTGKDLPEKVKSVKCKVKIKFKEKHYEVISYLVDGVPIWLYDVVRPDEEFSVGHYQCFAKAAIEDIQKRGKLPIVVGGTGLYIKSLIERIESIAVAPNKKLREELNILPVKVLQQRLREAAPNIWEKMNTSDRQNPRRLIRKIEIIQDLSQKLSFREPQSSALLQSEVITIGLTAPFSVLYKHIDERVDARVKQGILKEIQGLLDRGYSWDLPAMNTMGYKEWKPFFSISNIHPPAGGPISDAARSALKNQIIQQWKFHEHAYARRQMTWFRKQPNIHWFDIATPDFIQSIDHEVGLWYNR